MKDLIIKLLREQLEGTGDNPLSEKEIRMFKYANKFKKNLKTQKEFLDLFRTLMSMVGKPESDSRFYYEVYTANYRPEGDYENLNKENFVHYRDFKQKKTPNNNAYQYSSAKLPFKGSNLEGKWEINDNNAWYYVVTSYNWYPIYLFINNQWYRTSNSYSSSTSKHLSHSNPERRQTYDENIKDEVISVTPKEINSLMSGESYEDVTSKRPNIFMNQLGDELNKTKPSKLLTIGWGDDRKKVKFKIENVRVENNKIIFNINIEKAGTVEGTNKMVVNPEGYVYPSPFSQDLEDGISKKIIWDYSDFLNKKNTEFIFKHKNKN